MRVLSSVLFCSLIALQLSAQTSFQEIAALPFLDSDSYLQGISWVDVDHDYDLDVCITGFSGFGATAVNRSAIFINDGNGNFSNTGLLNSTQTNPWCHSWADIDNDDDLDLYIGATWNNMGINELWKNNGGASFTLTQNTGATPNLSQPYEGSISWADYNNDGWVDLFVPRWNDLKNKLYRNNGNGQFTEVTAGAIVNDLAWTSGGFWGDFDNDRDQDLFVLNYQIGATNPGNNDLFRNNGDGTFTKMSAAGSLVTALLRSRSANWVDANNDGRLDLFVCTQFGQDALHLNNGNGTFTEKVIGAANHTSWSSNWGDFDNDGDQDLITMGFWNTDSRFWQNDGQGNLTDITASYPGIFPTATSGSTSNTAIWVDADLDGWLDLHITQPDLGLADHFYKNLGDGCKSWLEVKCSGLESNHAAIGATIRAKATINGQTVWQMRQISAQTAAIGSNPLWQHFGFRDAATIDSLVVEWPSGKTCTFVQVAVNQFIEITEDCTMDVIQAAPPQEGSNEASSICLPATAPVQLTPPSPAGGTWVADCGNCIDQQGVFNPTGLAAGEYLIRYLQGGICGGTADSFMITLLPGASIVATGKDSVDFGEKVVLMATGGSSYTWEPAGVLSCATCEKPMFTADTTTTFIVTGADANGCTGADTLVVFVRPEPKLEIPNAFTPNGDQSNDIFRPTLKSNLFRDYHLSVYSRWGERVFETYNPGEGWDGKIGDLPLESDVYIFTFEYTLLTGESDKKRGEFTLLR